MPPASAFEHMSLAEATRFVTIQPESAKQWQPPPANAPDVTSVLQQAPQTRLVAPPPEARQARPDTPEMSVPSTGSLRPIDGEPSSSSEPSAGTGTGSAPGTGTGTGSSGIGRTAFTGTGTGTGSRPFTRRRTSTQRTSRRGGLGAGLVEVPPVPYREPSSAVMKDPVVAEHKRFCSNCGAKVGRGKDGKPGPTEGTCPKCGTPFYFKPKLQPGELVGGQY